MTLSSAPWWCAPVLALAWMWTVPAQIFCAPTRAKLIAAARFMPGVCGVLVSSWSPGMTLTPLVFQSMSVLSGFSLIAFLLVTGKFQEGESDGKYPENQSDQLDHVRQLRNSAFDLGHIQLHAGHIQLHAGHIPLQIRHIHDEPLQLGHIDDEPLQIGLDLAHVVFERSHP